MELTFDLEHGTLVRVLCDQRFSHRYDLQDLLLPDKAAVQVVRELSVSSCCDAR